MTKAQAVDLQAKSKPYDSRSPCEPLRVVLERIVDGCVKGRYHSTTCGYSVPLLADRAFAPTPYELGILLVLFFWSRDNLPPVLP